MKKLAIALVPQETIESKIFFLRGKRVMLDRDLAVLYGVETKYLKRQVKRNIARFPEDFMFQLTKDEFNNLRSQIGTSSWGGTRYLSYAFTEQGVAMLSSVLNSDRAIQVNIQIMRTFTKLREMLMAHKDLKRKIEDMEKKYDYQFKIVFDAIKQLLEPPTEPKGKIIPLRKGGIRGLCFFPGLFYNPLAPFIKGDFYIHYLLIRINKMKIPIQSR